MLCRKIFNFNALLYIASLEKSAEPYVPLIFSPKLEGARPKCPIVSDATAYCSYVYIVLSSNSLNSYGASTKDVHTRGVTTMGTYGDRGEGSKLIRTSLLNINIIKL